MTYIRSASLRGFRTVVAEAGGDADSLVRKVGLNPVCLDTDDMLLPLRTSAALLEHAAVELDCPDLGLRMARRQSVSVLGPIAVAMTNSPTIGAALECLVRYLFVHGRGLTLTLRVDLPHDDRGTAALIYGPATTAGPVQAVDLGMGFIHGVLLFLNGGPYGLRGVELPYRPMAPVSQHREFFGADVRIEQPVAAGVLRVPAGLLSRPLTGVNETIRQLAVAFLVEQSSWHADDLVSRIRTVVREAIGAGGVDLASTSRLLFMHPRTVQRKLAATGVTFAQIVDDARRETALRLLLGSDLPLGQIATRIGLVEQPSFTRACRRWWGVPPSRIRRQALAR